MYSEPHEDNISRYQKRAAQVLDHLSVVSQQYADFFQALKALEDRACPNAPSLSAQLSEICNEPAIPSEVSPRHQAILTFEATYATTIATGLSHPETLSIETQQEILGQFRMLGVTDTYQTDDWSTDFRNGLNWLRAMRENLETSLKLEKAPSTSPAVAISGLSAFQEKINRLREQHISVWGTVKRYHEIIQNIVGPAHEGLTGFLQEETRTPQILEKLPDLFTQVETFLERNILEKEALHAILTQLTTDRTMPMDPTREQNAGERSLPHWGRQPTPE